MSEFRSRASVAAIWSAIHQVGARGIGTIFMLVFARFISAEDFGIFAIANMAVGFLTSIALFSFPKQIVREEQLEDDVLNSLFWTSIIGSVSLGILLTLCVAIFFSEDGRGQYVYVFSLMSVGMVASAGAGILSGKLERDLDLRILARRTLIANVFSGVIATPFAILGYGLYALVIQYSGGALLSLILTIRFINFRIELKINSATVREAFRFGMPIFSADTVSRYSRESPKIFVGYFLGIEALGLFAMALRILNLLLEVVTITMNKVSFPLISQIWRSERGRAPEVMVRILKLAGLIIFPAYLLSAILAPALVEVGLGPDWTRIASPVTILCISGIFTSFAYITESSMIAIGVPKKRLKFALARAVVGTVFLVLLAPYGILGAAWAILLRSAIVEPIQLSQMLGVMTEKPLQLAPHFLSVVSAAGALVVTALALPALIVANSSLQTITIATSGSLLVFSVIALMDADLRREITRIARSVRGS